MKFLSLCSGMEAASVAWGPLGWQAGAFSEIDAACCDLLTHYYPDTPNLGDMTAPDFIERAKEYGSYDLICGGTPCQSFSMAGLRGGLNDDRGNLTLKFVEICNGIEPDWIFWENVPGVLSDKTNAFGCLLAGLVGEDAALIPPRGKWTDAGMVIGPRRATAWRVLNAEYFGLAQRRRRVYVLAGDIRAGANPAEVLFEPNCMRRNTPPSREKGEGVAGTLGGGAQSRGWCDDLDRAGAFIPEIAHSLRAEHDGSEDGTGRGTPIVPEIYGGGNCSGPIVTSAALNAHGGRLDFESESFVLEPVCYDMRGNGGAEIVNTLTGNHLDRPTDYTPVVAFTQNQSGNVLTTEIAPAMGTNQNATARNTPKIQQVMTVRRLTPKECERLMGFPDDYSLVPRRNGRLMADGPRYRMIGNSWPVPVVRWIGERIAR